MTSKPLRVALFLPSLRGGGVERVFLLLARGFADAGYEVDLVAASLAGDYLGQVDARVRAIDLGAPSTLRALPGLARYLRQNRPCFILSGMPHANIVNLLARWLSGYRGRSLVSEHSILSEVLRCNGLKERLTIRLSGFLYRFADGIIAVSSLIAEELAACHRLDPARIRVIYNPVDLPAIRLAGANPPEHPWLRQKTLPVILNAGRLVPVKDQASLLRAFALLRSRLPARLLILGEGPERPALEKLAAELDITEDVELAGFQQEIYAYLTHSDLFVLSSVYEGLPVSLIEALACGAPVVSTDCKSGPAEILENGRCGRLVPVGDPQALADAMEAALRAGGRNPDGLRRAQDFALEKIVRQYLAAAGQAGNEGAG